MDTRMKKGFTYTGITLLLLLASSMTSAASVTLSNVMDGNGSPMFFDPSGITQSGTFDEIITIGLDNFTADSDGSLTSAVDTLSMTITAPAGFTITSVSYTESGTGKTTLGVASASGSMVADGIPVNFLSQQFPTHADSGWSITPTPLLIDSKESISLNITNSLFAFAFDPTQTARVSKTAASLVVGLTAIPIPPAIWMMGAAIAALVTVGRRRAALS